MKDSPIRPYGVNVALFRRDKGLWKILMVQRASNETHPLAWGLVTGTREGDESLCETAFRELQEELSIMLSSLWATNHLIIFYEPRADRIWHAPVFVAILTDESLSLSSEIEQIAWLTSDEAIRLARWKTLKQVLPELFEEIACFPCATWQQFERSERS